MKIIFFGTSNIALPVLEALKNKHEILAIVTTPDAKEGRDQELQESPVSALAADLKLTTFKPESLKNNQEFFDQLKQLNADIFVVVSFGKILPSEIINLPKYKAVNVHPSALPKYRGPSPIRTALLNGDEFTGVTLMLMDEKLDSGPMLAQEIVKIDDSDNNFTLEAKLAKTAANMINPVLADYISGKITPLPQDEAKVSFTSMIEKQDGKINWQKTAQEIYNQFRAFYPWPGIWTVWKDKNLKITECSTIGYQSQQQFKPGTVLDNGVVACGSQTFLQIARLQISGKNETGILDFLNGYRDFVASNLE
jgi:methionyl-tRNA formyltransferase